MDHKVTIVQELYDYAEELYNNVVVKGDCSAENMLQDLSTAITNLKDNWKGIDAGGKIQEVITVYNALVKVRNDLARLACESSKVAVNYRQIQLANGAPGLKELVPLEYTEKGVLEDYEDTLDTIDINPSAEVGKNHIDLVVASIDTFIQQVSAKYDGIMHTWLSGTGRDSANESFQEFLSNAEKYKNMLNDVSTSIANALKNYSF